MQYDVSSVSDLGFAVAPGTIALASVTMTEVGGMMCQMSNSECTSQVYLHSSNLL